MKFIIYIVCCVVGSLIGGFIGALIGWGVAYWIVRAWVSRQSLGRIQTEDWVGPVFQILGHLAKVDGQVSRLELANARQFMQVLDLDEPLTEFAKQSFNDGKSIDFDLTEATSTLLGIFGPGTESTVVFFHYMVSICLADGNLSAAEDTALQELAEKLGVSDFQLKRIFASFGHFDDSDTNPNSDHRYQQRRSYHAPQRKSDLDEAYEVLGVSESATDSEIKKRYRRLLNQYHPDKLAAKGLPDSMMEFSKQQSAKIIQAWDEIKTVRGIV